MIIFAHDHKLRYDDGRYYTQGGLADKITQRYTTIYGNVTIICRAIPRKEKERNLSLLTNPDIEIAALHSGSLLLTSVQKRAIRETVKKADGVIVRLPSIIGEVVFKYAKELNKPILSEVVTCPWDSLWNHSLKGKVMAPLMWFKTRHSVKDSDYVLYVTKEFLQRRYPTKGLHTGCSDVEIGTPQGYVLEERIKKIPQAGDTKPLVLGTLASLNTRFKGQQYVMEAISQLRKNGKIFKYRLAGGGNDTYLHQQAEKFGVSDLIIWDGLVPHDKVFDWFYNLDIYIQPSEQEGLPRALVEAMSQACPCLGSDVGGIPELLSSDCIFHHSSASAIREKLEYTNAEWMKQQARLCFNKAGEFSSEKLEPERERFYTKFKKFVERHASL